MKTFESPFRSARAAAVFAGALAALVYANSLLNAFAYDDLNIIVNNPVLHTLATLPHAIAAPYWPGEFAKQLGLWRPLTTAYFGLQWVLFAGSPVPYHVVNLLGHVGVTAVVVLLLAELMSLPAAFVGGLIFAVHPVHVEAVSNVVGFSEVASSFFFLLACLVHVRGPDTTRWPRALLIGLLYAIAFGTKEGAVTLPAALFLLDAARRPIGFPELSAHLRERWRVYVTIAVVAGVELFLRFHVLGSLAHPFGPLGADLLQHVPRIWTLAEVWSHYVRLWVFPLDLSSDYSPNVIPIALGWNGVNVAGVVLALCVLLISLLLWRRPDMRPGRDTARIAAFGVVWFIITISPVSNIAFISGVMLAERTLYLPSVGLAAATGWLLVRFWRARPRPAVALTVVGLGLLGWRTWTRTPTWKTNDSVFLTMMSDHPESGRTQWVLGDLFLQQHRIHRALVAYGNAINILGPEYPLITAIGRKLMVLQDYRAAKTLYQIAWEEDPTIPVAPANLAVIYSEEGNAKETERFCRIAIRLGRDDAVSYHLLAWAYAKEGRWTLAAGARREAIARGQGDYWQQWESLAYLEWHHGDTASARMAFDSAVAKAKGRLALARIDSLRKTLLRPSQASRR
jgi:tetratricopeptide (TPR) repeat protein